MSLRDILLLALVAFGGIYLAISGRLDIMAKSKKEVRLLSPATDITDMPKTRHIEDVTDRVIEIRKQELSQVHHLDPKSVFITVKDEALQNKLKEHYTITFELAVKGVRGLYAERYTVNTTRKRMFQITDVQYDHKCTMGTVIQEWTVEPCSIKTGS